LLVYEKSSSRSKQLWQSSGVMTTLISRAVKWMKTGACIKTSWTGREVLQGQIRRRNEEYVPFSQSRVCMLTISSREPRLLDDAIVVTEPKHQNGGVVPMALGHCATLAGCVRTALGSFNCSTTHKKLDYAKLTRKMGSKASSTSSNLRPKEMDLSSPH